MASEKFQPLPALIEGAARAICRAIVIIPARDEEATLAVTLDALASQVDASHHPLPRGAFEILLLLNNCTDSSAEVACRWCEAHPQINCYPIEVELPPGQAHVGTARRMLMDTAWSRLRDRDAVCAILSTDADTTVAPDWIAQNLLALEGGADAVGGVIEMAAGELESLPAGAQRAYLNDRRYQRLVAELEDLLDPQDGDPWPRHLEHFGASLACKPEVYARAGGMPAVTPLEDVAFVDVLRRIDARLRHEPAVRVFTSSRLNGRAGIGLSHQLRVWQQASAERRDHLVPSPAFLIHRFRALRALREVSSAHSELQLPGISAQWQHRITVAREQAATVGEFLAEIDCDRWIDDTFGGEKEDEILRAVKALETEIAKIRSVGLKAADECVS